MKTLSTSITKILDFAFTEIGQEFQGSISGQETYDDTDFPKQNLYSPYNLKELQDEGELILSEQQSELLDEIFRLCAKKDCTYFRIIS